jgi:hypothetical protein
MTIVLKLWINLSTQFYCIQNVSDMCCRKMRSRYSHRDKPNGIAVPMHPDELTNGMQGRKVTEKQRILKTAKQTTARNVIISFKKMDEKMYFIKLLEEAPSQNVARCSDFGVATSVKDSTHH